MGLSKELISQFVKTTNDSKKNQNANVYGTAVKYGDTMYAKIDGSEMLTPISSAITAKPGDRILITIANHTATALGNLSTPSASSATVGSLSDQVFHKVTANEIDAVNASIDNIKAITIKTEYAEIVNGNIENLKAKLVDAEHLSAEDIKAINAEIENLEVKVGSFENLSADTLAALNGEIKNLKGYTADFTYVSAEILNAVKANIKELEATIIDAETGDFKFANIDFSNIGKTAIEQFFATSGLIKDVVVGDQTVTGELVGVTIKGDLIEGGTVKADKLVIKGEDGLFYKLNVDVLGETTASSDDKYQNGLDGSVILAKSVTATKIDVKDLVAFGATIGGFNISDSAIYSGVKESADNKTRGIYLDKNGQVAIGDGKNYIKYAKDADGNYILAISASEIIMASSGMSVEDAITNAESKLDDLEIGGTNLIRNSETMDFEDYYFEDEPLIAETDGNGGTAVTYNPMEVTDEDGTVEVEHINAEDDGEGTVSAYSLTEESAENVKETHEMDTLVMDGKSFEVVDKKARREIAVERGRIDQLVKLEEGSTTGDAELRDIRVGYDGLEHDTAGDAVRAIGNDLEAHKQEFDDYTKNKVVNGLYYEDNQLYLTTNGEISSDPVEIKQGTGNGGGGAISVLKLTNANPNNTFSSTVGKDVILRFTFLSLEDDIPTGDATCAISVNSVTKATFTIKQGLNEVNVKDYLSVGSNTVRITCTDIYGQYRSLSYIGSVIELSVESTFDDTVTYTGDITFKYKLYGLIEKTAHFIMDGVEIDTKVIKTSGTQYTKVFNTMPHGVHRLEFYSTAVLDGEDIESNHLVYDIMCTESGVTSILIGSPFTVTKATQGEQISIPYSVYNPAALSADVTLTIYTMSAGSRNVYAETPITVDRTRQTWNTRKYPIGTVYFEIKAGEATKTHKVEVNAPSINISPETNDLEVELLSTGRSNNESDPAHWAYGDVTTTFEHVNWDSTGWVEDADGDTALHLNGAATATIAYKPFEKDLRIYGKTIEMEFVIRDVNNRDAVVIDCMSGGIGIKATADRAMLHSELATIDCRYKEDVKVKVAFVVEARNENRMMSVYLNGVLSGTKQYTTNDNFQQTTPVEIKIGSPYCAIDLYSIRAYDTALNAPTMLNNYIADIQDIGKKVEVYENNNIFDEYGQVSYELVKDKLPTITIVGKLPTAKGNKQNVTFIFKDPRYPFLDFDGGCVIDVQGTSSQYYVIKNFKVKFTESHQHAPDMMEAKVFCIKVDYAEATGTHNTQLANFVHTLYEEKMPPQLEDERVRSSIYGFPCVVFHQENESSEPVFYGKANFNYDKGSENVFGFTDEYDVECWEFCNNTSDVCNFKSTMPENWKDDFESRYPEGNTDITRLADLIAWVQKTKDNLEQFKNEFENHFNLESVLIFYIITLFVLGVDQRAKNMMFTFWAANGKWYIYFYDNDTIFCIDNEGNLVFAYWHEDIDQLDGANVFNGQGSVFWNNFRVAFADEIAAKYRELRSSGKLTYDALIERFITNGSDMWPESIYNTDLQTKYINPLNDGDASNLYQVRGDGEMHLMYFLQNRFKYMDSKFYAEDYADDYVYFRIYTPVDEKGNARTDLAVPACADVTITTYAAMYAGIRYKANGTLQQQRAMENETVHFKAPDETFNDTETSVYGASCISSLGDLSGLYLGSINAAKATHIIELILGSPTEGYDNPNLTEVTVGNNKLLKTINIQNCSKLTESLDLSGCPNIEEIYADGSAITGIDLVKGGHVRVMHLPNTIRNLTLLNQHYIEDFKMAGYDKLKTMRIENCVGVDEVSILQNATNLERVRLVGVDWYLEDVSFLKWLYTSGIAGIDETGANVDEIQVSGKCYVESLTGAEYAEIVSKWPYLEISYGHLSSYLYFMSEDGTEELTRQLITNGADGSEPVSAGTIATPTKESTAQYHFTFAGWSKVSGGDADDSALANVEADRYVYAAYSKTLRSYTVRFLNYDGTVLQTTTADYGTDAKYTGSTPTNNSTANTSDFYFTGWKPSPTNIRGNTDCYAQYYDTREITDDLATIKKNCYSGYSSNYPIGAYKNVYVGGKDTPIDASDEVVYDSEIHIFNNHIGENAKQHFRWNGNEWVYCSTTPFTFAGNNLYSTNCVEYNGELHIVGGEQHATSHHKWDGTKWTLVSNLPYEYYQGGTVVYNNEIHILGTLTPAKRNSHLKWDGHEWTEASTLPYDFTRGAVAVFNNEIHILGSMGGAGHCKWDGHEWLSVESMPVGLYGGSAVTYNNKIYFMRNGRNQQLYSWDGFSYTLEGNKISGFLFSGSNKLYRRDDKIIYYYSETDKMWIQLGTTEVIPMEVIDHDHDEIPDDEFMFVESDIPKLPDYGRCVVHDNELYSIWANEETEGKSYKYNASTNTWDVLCENTPTMAIQPTLVSYNGEIHSIGGSSNGTDEEMEKFRSQHLKWDGSAWTILDVLPFHCNEPRYVVVYKDKIHMVNGGRYTNQLGQHWVYDGTSWSEIDSGVPSNIAILGIFVWNDTIYAVGWSHYWTYNGDKWSDPVTCETGKSASNVGMRAALPMIMTHNNTIYIVDTNDARDTVFRFDETGFTKIYAHNSTKYVYYNTMADVVYYNYRWYAVSYFEERNRKISWGEFELDDREWVGWSAGQYNERTNWGVYFEIGNNLYYCAGGDVVKLSGNTWTDLARAGEFDSSVYGNRYDTDGNKYIYCVKDLKIYRITLSDGTVDVICEDIPYNHSPFFIDDKLHLLDTVNNNHNIFDLNTNTIESGYTRTGMGYSLNGFATVHNDILYSFTDKGVYKLEKGATEWIGPYQIKGFEGKRPAQYNSNFGNPCWYNNKLYMVCEAINWGASTGNTWCVISTDLDQIIDAYIPVPGRPNLAVCKNRLYLTYGGGVNNDGTLRVFRKPKAHLTFAAKTVLNEERPFNDTGMEWVVNYTESSLRTWLNGDFYSSLPESCKSVIQPVSKYTAYVYTDPAGILRRPTQHTEEKCWIPSPVEIGTHQWTTVSELSGEGSAYSSFTDNSSRIRKDSNGVAQVWHTRSAYSGNININHRVDSTGRAGTDGEPNKTTDPASVLPCFCI